MIKFLMQLFCKHNYIDKCTCGDSYQSLCSYRKKYGHCYAPKWDCDYLYRKCTKCGKEEWKTT